MQQLRSAIAAAGSRRQVDAVFGAAMRQCGFTAYAAGYVPDAVSGAEPPPDKPHPFLLLDWPASWLELYARQGFAAEDITLVEAARTSEPFTWSELRQRQPGASDHIFAAASRFGWNDGFVIPVHDPAGSPGERFGVVNLAAPRLDGFQGRLRAGVTEAALAAFGAARAIGREDRPRSAALALSEREAQALALVASGLSDEEIARRLAISRNTAHHHVESAKRRLNAGSRAQAVAIALTNNLLALPVL